MKRLEGQEKAIKSHGPWCFLQGVLYNFQLVSHVSHVSAHVSADISG